MILNGEGGGNTKTGLIFEGQADLAIFLATQNGYTIENEEVFYDRKLVARVFKKHGFYKLLEKLNIDWKNIISKKLLTDDSIYVIKTVQAKRSINSKSALRGEINEVLIYYVP